MTTRVAVLPYGPSDSCRLLRDALVTAYEGNPNVRPRMLLLEGSVFRGRATDVIINYGNRSANAEIFGSALVLNPQSALNNAANKLTALTRMQQAGVSTVEFTTTQSAAQAWVAGGSTVYSRSTLTGHSGEGIVVHNDPALVDQIPRVPLYTKAIVGNRREWRVHVFKGVITYVQVKRRRDGYREDPNYREDIRNHHTGWIYATENINPSDAVLRNAVDAVAALGLDFGAVDLISRNDDAWVLEVNTAPGLSGTNLETFTTNVVEFINARIENRQPTYTIRFVVPPRPVVEAPVAEADEEAPFAEPEPVARRGNGAPVTSIDRETVQDTRPGGSNRDSSLDGYYTATVSNQSGRLSQANVILYRSNGRYYRHGWNAPVESNRLSQIHRIASLTHDNGSVVTNVGSIN